MGHVSHSQFVSYSECNLKWKLRYIDKLGTFTGHVAEVLVFDTIKAAIVNSYFHRRAERRQDYVSVSFFRYESKVTQVIKPAFL